MPLATFLNGGSVTQLRGLPFLALSGSGYMVNNSGGTSDSGGGRTSGTVHGGTVACRIDPLGGAEGEVASRVSDRSTHLITLPPDYSIDHSDQFYSIDESETYEITAVRDRTAEWMQFAEAVKLD